MTNSRAILPLLRLSLTPGLGPVMISRLLEAFGTAEEALKAESKQLQSVEGIGPKRAESVRTSLRTTEELAAREFELASTLGVRLLGRGDSEYPPLLAQLPDAPSLLYCRGTLEPSGADRFTVGIVGSRECSAYGLEQARRFGSLLAGSGLTIVSGGARGIDTASHRGALDAGGRTIAVLGCGLAHCYPPENDELFAAIAGHGAVISELPLNTPPTAENFPARNRIISGLCLGVVVIEAGRRSGALITARVAAEEHGREVMALPGRVDSPSCQGTLDLLKQGGATLVTEPGDVIAALEGAAHHHHRGTHAARYPATANTPDSLFVAAQGNEPKPVSGIGLSPEGSRILQVLEQPMSADELSRAVSLDAAQLRVELTMLELQRRVIREGTRLRRA